MKSPWTLSRWSFVLVAVSAAIAVLSVLALAVVGGTYAAREDFAATTAVRNAELFPDEPANIRARPLWVGVDGRSVTAIVAEPIEPDAPPPFGLSVWPEPGQFLVSPDLAERQEELEARFGELVGTLPSDSLPSAYPRIILARPIQPLDDRWAASGFGVVGPLQLVATQASGFFLDERIGRQTAFGGIVLAGVVPAMILLATAVRSAGRRHELTTRVLEVLGVGPGRLHRASSARQFAAAGIGVGFAGLLLVVTSRMGLPVPFAEFTIRSIDVQRHPDLYVEAWIAGAVLTAAVIYGVTRPRRLAQSNRPRAVLRSRLRPWLATAGVVVVLLASQMAVSETAAAVASGQDNGAILWVIGGSLVALSLTPAMVGEVFSGLGSAITQSARRRESATGLLFGRGLQESRRAVQIATAGAALVVIAGLASTWALMGATPAVQAQRVIDRIDGRFVTIASPNEGGESDVRVLSGLPDGMGLLTVVSSVEHLANGEFEFHSAIYGSESSLEHWQLPVGGRLPAARLPGFLDTVISSGGETPVDIAVGGAPIDATPGAEVLYVGFNDDGSRVDRNLVQRSVSRIGGPTWTVFLGGEGWIIGANDLAHDFRWIGWFAVVGSVLLIASVWMRTLDDQRDQILSGLPIDSLFASRPTLPALLSLRVAAIGVGTVAVGGGTAALFARVTSGSLTTTNGSLPVVAVICLGLVGTLAALAAPQLILLRRSTHEWTPGGGGG